MGRRLIDADKLKAHYSWWKGGGREMTMDEAKSDFDTIIDLQPTVEVETIEVRATYEQKAYNEGYYDGYRDGAYDALEAEPVKHGRWGEKHYCSNLTGYDYAVVCSECEKPTYRQFAEPTPNYCPNCGAKMDAQIGEDKSHPFAESVMMGMDGGENEVN